MTQIELISIFWTLIGVLMLLGVLLSAIRMGLDEQRERESKFSGSGDVPRSPQQTTPEGLSDPRPADSEQ